MFFEDMTVHMKQYFKEHAASSIDAVIAFNGNGSPGGICVGDEREEVPLDNVLDDVVKRFNIHKSKSNLPERVTVIFCQSSGHLYTDCYRGHITVIIFTYKLKKTESMHSEHK